MSTIEPLFDRLPPHDIEAEQCAIASMILSVSAEEFHAIRRTASRDHFYQADHQIIHSVLCDLRDAGRPTDAVILRSELHRRGILAEVGGAGYIAQMMNTVPSAAHGEHYAKIVREKALLRGCISTANALLRNAYATSLEDHAADIASKAIRELSILATTGLIEKIRSLEDAVADVISRKGNDEVRRIPTGLIEFDDAIGGLPKGKFTMIGGRPGMGKSLVIKQILRNIAGKGIRVGIISIEETCEKIAENSLAAASGIANNKIAYGNLSQEEWAEVINGAVQLAKLSFHIADYPTKLADVENAITTLAVEKKCEVIAIDYIQLIDGDEENENREITMVSRAIKAAFKRLGVAGVAAAQLNRLSEHGEPRWPTLKDLRGSGSLEQDGDLIVLLHSEDYFRRQKGDHFRDNKLMLLVRKNKDGPQADVPVLIDPKTQEIKNWNGGVSNIPPFGSEAA